MNSCKTCKTCRFWKEDRDIAAPFRKCDRSKELSGDDCNPYTGIVKPSMTQNEFGSHDFDGYKSEIVTGPDFGCVLHEPTN